MFMNFMRIGSPKLPIFTFLIPKQGTLGRNPTKCSKPLVFWLFALTLVHFNGNSSASFVSLASFDFLHSHRCIFIKIHMLSAFLYSFLTFCIHIGAFSLKIVLFLHFKNIFLTFLCPHLCVFIKIHSFYAFHDFVLLFAITFLTYSAHIGAFPMKFIHCMFLLCDSILAKFFFRAYSFLWALESHSSIIWMYLVYFGPLESIWVYLSVFKSLWKPPFGNGTFQNRVSAFLNFKSNKWLYQDLAKVQSNKVMKW